MKTKRTDFHVAVESLKRLVGAGQLAPLPHYTKAELRNPTGCDCAPWRDMYSHFACACRPSKAGVNA